MNHLREELSQSWLRIQGSLFPWLQEELGPLTKKQQQLITILELIRIEEHLRSAYGGPGRPRKDRAAIARAFVAKMVYAIPCTNMLLERLKSDKSLRRICGWEYQYQVPSESVFSHANAEFAESRLPERVHAALVQTSYEGELAGHISRDSTAINAREKPAKKEPKKAPAKRGRPKKGEERSRVMTRLERQASGMNLAAMLDDLPKACTTIHLQPAEAVRYNERIHPFRGVHNYRTTSTTFINKVICNAADGAAQRLTRRESHRRRGSACDFIYEGY